MASDADFKAKVDALLEQSRQQHPIAATAVPATPRVKASYSPDAMVQLILDNPDWSDSQYAQHFGKAPSWFASVLASEAFQQALAPVKHLVANPHITATLEERLRMLTIRSVSLLGEKLNTTAVNDMVVLKSMELGIKGLGMDRKAPELPAPADNEPKKSVAEKLLEAMDARDKLRSKDAAIEVEVKEVPGPSDGE